jgi:hypothetical protein
MSAMHPPANASAEKPVIAMVERSNVVAIGMTAVSRASLG